MSAVRVIDPGMQSSVQDLGRAGYQQMGVPTGGAFDREAHLIGSLILGNDSNDASIEMTLVGGVFQFEGDARICLSGGHAPDASLTLGERSMPVSHQRLVHAARGSVLRVGSITEGMRTYLSIAGGFTTKSVLGSRSALVSTPDAGLGRSLRAGDMLPVGIPGKPSMNSIEIGIVQRVDRKIRIVPGHHMGLFDERQIQQLGGEDFVVQMQSNRAGIRLGGTKLVGDVPGRVASVGTLPGYVQIPSDGYPIVLGVDGPVTGGYPVIACVIEADLPRVAQARPNDRLRFEWVDRNAAIRVSQGKAD